MSKVLAVSWNAHSLRYVFAETQKRGAVRVLNAGEKSVHSVSGEEEDESGSSGIVERLKEVVGELKAGRATLILCVGRGSVDSTRFSVPPASHEELPTLVRNMAQRQLTGLGDDATIDFIGFPPGDDGAREVSAMAMSAEDERLIQEMVSASGCTESSAVVVTHPLRVFAPPHEEEDHSASLIVSKGLQSAHLLVVQQELPVLSRTVRLAPGASHDAQAMFVAAEIQRTVLTIGDRLEDGTEISSAVLVGSTLETQPLAGNLEGTIDARVAQVSAGELVGGDVTEATQGAYAPLIAAVLENARGTTAAVDFLNPKRPPTTSGRHKQLLAAAAVVMLVAGGGWYYIHSMFDEWNTKIADAELQLELVNEQVKSTASMRRQASGIMRWERSRMNWLDEIRDLTIRMPSSPELSVRQFAATPTGSGFTVTFQGTTRSPDAHRAMELGIQDRYHSTRTPSFSESRSGEKVVWNFRTTLQIKKRSNKEYTAHKELELRRRPPEPPASSDAAETSESSESPQKTSAPQEESTTADDQPSKGAES